MKQQTVISVVKMGSKGMVVTFNGGAEECLEGVGNIADTGKSGSLRYPLQSMREANCH